MYWQRLQGPVDVLKTNNLVLIRVWCGDAWHYTAIDTAPDCASGPIYDPPPDFQDCFTDLEGEYTTSTADTPDTEEDDETVDAADCVFDGGHPTEPLLAVTAHWPHDDLAGLGKLLQSVWPCDGVGSCSWDGAALQIRTEGTEGAEMISRALQANAQLWQRHWSVLDSQGFVELKQRDRI